jgi:hypothetical protein
MAPNQIIRLLALIFGVAVVAGCTGFSSRLSGDIPRTGSIIPNTTFQITPLLAIPLEKIVYWGTYAGAAYRVLDPYAPNWDIEEANLPKNQVHLALKMKRYYSGGAGEARAVFHHRAKELVKYGGFEGYEVLEYNESLESSILGSQRMVQGVIRLAGGGLESESPQGNALPARMIPDSAKNPRS